jgi:hypothetical protein
MAERDDPLPKVGYKHPPRATRFKPGTSGNPKGRPKGAKNFGKVIEDELRVRIPVVENGRRRKITKRQAVAKQLVNKAAAGDFKAIPTLLNEARRHDEDVSAQSANGVFGGPEDQKVIEGIIKRIRGSTSGPR